MYRYIIFLAILTADRISFGFSFRPQSIHKNNIAMEKRNSVSSYSFQSSLQHPVIQMQKDASTNLRGGSIQGKSSSLWNTLGSFWGSFGVIMILANSIKRIVPIALEPLLPSATPPLTSFQMGAYIFMCLYFAYVEGYKGFQLKFSPLVVSRSLTLKPFQGSPIHHVIFGPFYSMGLFHATKRRQIISWSVSTGVLLIVAAVKRLPYPWRNIIDAGVVVGLTWGSLSILIQWIQAIFSDQKDLVDPCLPEEK
jgi:hypothetical protein